MTLKKVETTVSHPFLRPYEAEYAGSAKMISEPRTMDTQFGEGNVIDVQLAKLMPKKDYEILKITGEEIEKRLDNPTRTWFMNGRTFNHLIDQFGDKEKNWVDKEVKFQVEKQMVKGDLTKVIYVEGSL